MVDEKKVFLIFFFPNIFITLLILIISAVIFFYLMKNKYAKNLIPILDAKYIVEATVVAA